MSDHFHIKPLSVNPFTGDLDQRSIAIVASTIVLRLFDLWPAEMAAILASWPQVMETAENFARPLVRALDGGAHD